MENNVIYNLSKKFSLRIIKLYSYLCDEKKEYVISKQLYRSGTSIGANIAEAQYAQTKADFVTKMHISLKEANETKYWLTLLFRAEYLNENEYESMMTDLRIIIGTLVNTIKKTKDNQ